MGAASLALVAAVVTVSAAVVAVVVMVAGVVGAAVVVGEARGRVGWWALRGRGGEWGQQGSGGSRMDLVVAVLEISLELAVVVAERQVVATAAAAAVG